MLMVTPVSCMITSAVRIDSGMLIAATTVARMLNRNRKIVRIAKIAPRPPSRTRPVGRFLDEHGQVRDGRDRQLIRVARADLGQLGLDRVGHLDRVGVGLLGDGDGQGLVAVGPAEAGRGHELGADGAEVADGDRLRDGRGGARTGAGATRRGAGDARRGRLREPDDEAPDLRLGRERADGRDRDLRAVGRDLARRDRQVVRLEDADDLLAGDARRAPSSSGRG